MVWEVVRVVCCSSSPFFSSAVNVHSCKFSQPDERRWLVAQPSGPANIGLCPTSSLVVTFPNYLTPKFVSLWYFVMRPRSPSRGRNTPVTVTLLLRPDREAEYCDERVCLCVSVCLSVCNHIFGTTRLTFKKNCLYVLHIAVAQSSSGSEVIC